jgi:hypothetical protein
MENNTLRGSGQTVKKNLFFVILLASFTLSPLPAWGAYMGEIESGEVHTGTMDARADTDIFQFYGDAGDRVIITASSGSVQPEIFLYPPDSGPYEALATGTSYNKSVDHQLLQTGCEKPIEE